MDSKLDPQNYLKLSEPHENREAASEAIENFSKELYEIRNKYKIRDVLIIINDSAKTDDEIGEFMITHHFGSALKMLPLAAYAYGELKEEHSNMISKLLAKNKK